MGKEIDQQTSAEQNSQRSLLNRFRLLNVIGVVFAVAAMVAGWFYFNQDTKPVTLKIGSGPYRSDSFELMREVADVVKRHSDRLVVKVVPTSDSSKNISLLNRKKVDVATIRSDTPVVNEVRMIANLFPDYFQIIARRDAKIRSVNDLVYKRIGIPVFGTDEFRSFWVVGDHYDLPINDMDWRVMDFDKASDQLLSGDLDAVFTVRSLRDRLLINLFQDAELKRQNLDFLEIDQANAIALKRPFLGVGEIPKGAFVGASPTPAYNATTTTAERVLVTRNDVDVESIRELTRILFEHRLDLTIRFALASAIAKPGENGGLGIPLHEGAEQYFNRDEPSFVQENAEPLALMVTVLTILVSSLLALRARLVSKQKNKMDAYNYALLEVAEEAEFAETLAEIKFLRAKMFTTLEIVVRALDTDEVTEEGFQSFSFLSESVREILNERSREIEREGENFSAAQSSKTSKKKPAKSRQAKNA